MTENKELNHTGTISMETDRLLLRRVDITDALGMYEGWASKEAVTKFLPWTPHKKIEDTIDTITNWVDRYENNYFYQWGIVIKETNIIIGTITIVVMDDKNYCCEVGYCISDDYWGKGYTSEALIKVIDYMINTVGYNRIESKYVLDNESSFRVMQKSGMNYEGTLKQKYYRKGQFLDFGLCSIVKDDLK